MYHLLFLFFLHCPLSGPVLTYISLLIIPCMIVYVTNKREPWTLNLEVNGVPKQPDYKLSSEYLPLCSEQTHSYRFGSTWGWVNDDRIFIFGCTVSLRQPVERKKHILNDFERLHNCGICNCNCDYKMDWLCRSVVYWCKVQ